MPTNIELPIYEEDIKKYIQECKLSSIEMEYINKEMSSIFKNYEYDTIKYMILKNENFINFYKIDYEYNVYMYNYNNDFWIIIYFESEIIIYKCISFNNYLYKLIKENNYIDKYIPTITKYEIEYHINELSGKSGTQYSIIKHNSLKTFMYIIFKHNDVFYKIIITETKIYVNYIITLYDYLIKKIKNSINYYDNKLYDIPIENIIKSIKAYNNLSKNLYVIIDEYNNMKIYMTKFENKIWIIPTGIDTDDSSPYAWNILETIEEIDLF